MPWGHQYPVESGSLRRAGRSSHFTRVENRILKVDKHQVCIIHRWHDVIRSLEQNVASVNVAMDNAQIVDRTEHLNHSYNECDGAMRHHGPRRCI